MGICPSITNCGWYEKEELLTQTHVSEAMWEDFYKSIDEPPLGSEPLCEPPLGEPINVGEPPPTNIPIRPINRKRIKRKAKSFTFDLPVCTVADCPNKSTHKCSYCERYICELCLYKNVYTRQGGSQIIYCLFCQNLFIL